MLLAANNFGHQVGHFDSNQLRPNPNYDFTKDPYLGPVKSEGVEAVCVCSASVDTTKLTF